MNRKDIALTVGGTVASLSLAYLFYRRQRAEAEQAQAEASADPAYTIADGSTTTYYGSDGYYPQQLTQVSVPSLASSVTTSGSTAASGGTGTSIDSTDATDMITKLVQAFQTTTNPNILPSYVATDPYAAAIASIPTSAGDALNQATSAHPGITAVHDTTATSANSIRPASLTSTHDLVSAVV